LEAVSDWVLEAVSLLVGDWVKEAVSE